MQSIKLNTSIRGAILDAVLGQAFDKEGAEIKKDRIAFSEKIYRDIYNKTIRETMDSLPEGWLPETSSIAVQFGQHSSGVCHRDFDKPHRVLEKHRSGIIKIYDINTALYNEHHDLTARYDDFHKRRNEARRQARAIIDSCNTTKQLKEVWPAIAKFVEAWEPTENRKTQIVPITDGINKILGLTT